MVKVVRFLVSPSQNSEEMSTLDKAIQSIVGKPEKTQYIYSSCLLELLYRSLQIFLVCEQSLISKQQKTKFTFKQLDAQIQKQKKDKPASNAADGGDRSGDDVSILIQNSGSYSGSARSFESGLDLSNKMSEYNKLKKKIKDYQQELRQLNGFQLSQDSIKFVQKLKAA